MRREIKFRGRCSKDNKTWFIGSLVSLTDIDEAYIDHYDGLRRVIECYPVDPYTVGQYIGAPDSKDNESYEGDIVKFGDCIAEVAYNAKFASFGLYAKGWAFMHYFGEACNADQCEVIGNIHDSPELLEDSNGRL